MGCWHLKLVELATGETKSVPYRCGSWRHAGKCAKARAADDARRIREGLLRYGLAMAYLVLTFNPADFHGGTDEAYRKIVDCWAIFYKRVVREWGKAPYVLLVEEHKNHWPHVNGLLGGHVGAEVAADRWRAIRRVLKPMVLAAGFGMVLHVDSRPATPALAQYIAKYCTKAEQAPVHAPRKFRRLRSSHGFLGAAKPRGEKFTGELVTDAPAEYREEMQFQRQRARDGWRRVAEAAGNPFFRAVEERSREMYEALARGEISGAEVGITDDPETWPEEWLRRPEEG